MAEKRDNLVDSSSGSAYLARESDLQPGGATARTSALGVIISKLQRVKPSIFNLLTQKASFSATRLFKTKRVELLHQIGTLSNRLLRGVSVHPINPLRQLIKVFLDVSLRNRDDSGLTYCPTCDQLL